MNTIVDGQFATLIATQELIWSWEMSLSVIFNPCDIPVARVHSDKDGKVVYINYNLPVIKKLLPPDSIGILGPSHFAYGTA